MCATTEVERKLATIWQELLGITRIGINDNFFEIGGHSLKAMTMVAVIHRELNIQIPLKEVFKAPTIQELAQFISATEKTDYAAIQPTGEQAYYPVSSAQKRMYLLWRLEGDSITYNIPGAAFIHRRIEREQLESWFKTLIARHETLRTSFEMVDNEPVQRYPSHSGFCHGIHGISGLDPEMSNSRRSFML